MNVPQPGGELPQHALFPVRCGQRFGDNAIMGSTGVLDATSDNFVIHCGDGIFLINIGDLCEPFHLFHHWSEVK